MAIDNLNYYSSGLPAGQQTDKYSSQPGCLKSKNLDIFSSSKSVKATAWSTPTTTGADIIKQDGDLILKTDGKVYSVSTGEEVLVVDPSVNFPVYQVSYDGKDGTYADAQRGTPQDLVVKYDGDEWKSYIVYTDRASYLYSKTYFVVNKSLRNGMTSSWDWDDDFNRGNDNYIRLHKTGNSTTSYCRIYVTVEGQQEFTKVPVRFKMSWDKDTTTLTITSSLKERKYYYDAQLDAMVSEDGENDPDITMEGNINDGLLIYLPTGSETLEWEIRAKANDPQSSGNAGIDVNFIGDYSPDNNLKNGDYNDYYSYLPVRERKLVSVGDYGYSESYWMKGTSFQPLYKWTGSWIDENGDKKILYDFVTDMGWESDVGMDVTGMIIWNEQAYMIGNLDGNGYIIPCDLTGGRGTPYIAYGCEFKGAVNIDYLMYLVGEDRGISTLWAFNQQELVPVIGGKQESKYIDRIGVDEQYKFDGKILNRRKNLILSTTDYRIFQYGQTYGGKGGAFIHELTGPVTEIKAKGNDLVVSYLHLTPRSIETWSGDVPQGLGNFDVEVYSADGNSVLGTHAVPRKGTTAESLVDEYGEADGFTGVSLTLDGDKLADDYPLYEEVGETLTLYAVPDYISATKKNTAYQDDTPIKNYNTEWMATYPIVLGNHLLEKEESDLYVSYILPSADTSLEFWGMANHYHFWTFTSGDDVTLSTSVSYKLKGATGDYSLKFIEKNGDQYTFRLEGDLPVQTTSKMKITDSEGVDVLSYSKFNHFRKIGEIATTEYQEGEFRFHNLNSKLELPKSYSLQIMVKGKGTVNYTPELFSVDLVANQRNRG